MGRELITDRVTAIFELVKNCYDANATKVDIDFIDVSHGVGTGQIIISDNGQGMTFEDVRDKWMVVGTNSKRERTSSGSPFFRRMVGEKGVGRFAVEKLGSKLLLQSKKASQPTQINVEIIWDTYEELSAQYNLFSQEATLPTLRKKAEKAAIKPKKKYFTEIDNRYWHEVKNNDSQYTTLVISGLRETWTGNDISRVYKELSKLISPLTEKKEDFTINIRAKEFEEYKKYEEVKNKGISESSINFSLKYNLENRTQEVIKFNGENLVVSSVPIKKMGPVEMALYYLDTEAKRTYKNLTSSPPDGIKIYRDNLITTPFAEFESQDDKKRDVIGIDKRKHNAFFDRVGSRDLIGYVAITKAQNPEIIDATNRQDFVENEEYRALKQFIIDQVVELEKLLKYQREASKQITTTGLQSARVELDAFTQVVQQTIRETPQLTQQLNPLLQVAKRVRVDFAKGIKAYERLEKEKVRQENIFMSLMSLQEYAAQIAHVVRTSLARVLHLAEFFKDFFPNEEYNDIFATYSKNIYDEMMTLDRAIEYMLSYALADTDKVAIDIKDTIEGLLFRNYKDILAQKDIRTIVEINKSVIINTNERVIIDIFENLITNSIKALNEIKGEKIIKCSGSIDDQGVNILFSDNGKGIDVDDYERIFNVYYTTSAEQGGAGIGLFVAKTRVESLKGTINVVKPEFHPQGATFKITFPFNK
ncbi:sensor histidine kinase [Hymenobacter convexus]|uniref:sensor histidine kinase n=1 Tax=Hymenobacter sp. CA1UV-4 TaxID=3063782 RepID=UPI00272C3022|nr:sensor histidine kinase [Hymenobacter sp. CA1UV-4]